VVNKMKKYNVYGIGNALVDLEYAVNEDFFRQMNVEKGLMTLVDLERQMELLTALEDIPGGRSGGGSAANTLYAIAKLGGKAYYSCRVAHDEMGDFFLQDLKEAGIDTNLSALREKGTTGTCLVMVTPDAERTMNTFLGISSEVCHVDVDEAALANSDYFYIEGYLVTSASAKEAVLKSKALAEKNGVKTAISLSDPNMVKFFRQGLQEMIGSGVDLLFCNEAEALEWSNTQNLQEAILALKKIARQFVITLGSKGALLFDGQQALQVAAFPVKAVDTNGAGDIFAGAFLYGITNGLDFPTAGRLASHSAATLITHFGARLPRDHYSSLLSIIG